MTALGIGAELRFVDRGEGEIPLQVAGIAVVIVRNGHAFSGAEEIARVGRHNPLFAGQQSDFFFALYRDDPVVDLAREQPQREADHSRRMAAHPLDREMRLAGVRGPKDRPNRCICTRGHVNRMWQRLEKAQVPQILNRN
jgi:hypothetical protein